jgi:hypothetical protein
MGEVTDRRISITRTFFCFKNKKIGYNADDLITLTEL